MVNIGGKCSNFKTTMTSGKPSKMHPTIQGQSNGHQVLNETEQNELYRRGVKMLQERCKAIQKNNERIVHRLHVVKQMTKRRSREVEMLKNRLDRYNDGWRTAPQPVAEKPEESKEVE
ncbi:TCF3 fusion partner homolog [Topomyia yanbarensis]|uniref:TCF3 fusion partner homolog n=1 Tax=Topomyia yanbarensis TaxID=2498891 RepID=UPI00273BD97F|nr:TCF3 fusion partner homolog [Topomyia yanbarensis]